MNGKRGRVRDSNAKMLTVVARGLPAAWLFMTMEYSV